jgi:hypothetical protein
MAVSNFSTKLNWNLRKGNPPQWTNIQKSKLKYTYTAKNSKEREKQTNKKNGKSRVTRNQVQTHQ